MAHMQAAYMHTATSTYATVSVKLVLDGGLPYAHVLFSRDTLAKTSGVEDQLFAARVCHEL